MGPRQWSRLQSLLHARNGLIRNLFGMTSNTETKREGLKMASSFYIVIHHFKPVMAAEWWSKTGALMSDEAAFAENTKSTMEKGFFNHSFMPMAAEGPIYCVWEAKEGISDSEFQDFIDGPDGVNWGLVALNNNVMKLDLALTGGQTPYESKF